MADRLDLNVARFDAPNGLIRHVPPFSIYRGLSPTAHVLVWYAPTLYVVTSAASVDDIEEVDRDADVVEDVKLQSVGVMSRLHVTYKTLLGSKLRAAWEKPGTPGEG